MRHTGFGAGTPEERSLSGNSKRRWQKDDTNFKTPFVCFPHCFLSALQNSNLTTPIHRSNQIFPKGSVHRNVPDLIFLNSLKPTTTVKRQKSSAKLLLSPGTPDQPQVCLSVCFPQKLNKFCSVLGVQVTCYFFLVSQRISFELLSLHKNMWL